jgi:hypothetical protein
MMKDFDKHIVLKLIKEYREVRSRNVPLTWIRLGTWGRPSDKEEIQVWNEMDIRIDKPSYH